MAKPELHQSDLTMLLLCGEAYRRKVLEKEWRPSPYYAARGTCAHKAREKNLSQKIESKTDLSLGEVQAAARDEAVRLSDEGVDGGVFGETMPKQGIKDRLIDESVTCASLDYTQFQTAIRPIGVELQVTVELPNYPFDLGGRLDLADDQGAVRDLKVRTRTPSKREVDCSDQLSLYSILYHAWQKKPPTKLFVDALIMLKRGNKAVAIETARTLADQQATLNKFAMAWEAIEKGVFLPAAVGSWKCSRKWCEYYGDCRYVSERLRSPQSEQGDDDGG